MGDYKTTPCRINLWSLFYVDPKSKSDASFYLGLAIMLLALGLTFLASILR